MKRNLVGLYALAACFASVMFLFVSAAISSGELLRIFAPSVTVASYAYERAASDERFLQSLPQGQPPPPSSEIARLRGESLAMALRSERHDGLRSFLPSLAFPFAAAVVFWIHWRLARRERRNVMA